MSDSARQIAIAFPFEPRYSLDNFVVGANEELIARLRVWHEDGTTPVVWFHGGRRSGRSHLLQAVCAWFAGLERPTAYVPSEFTASAPESLHGLDAMGLVALDDLDAWLGEPAVEETLFVLYGALAQSGGKLLIASTGAPATLRFALPDLASRLRAAALYALRPPDDAAKGQIVIEVARERGLEVPKDVLNYLFTRGPRDLDGLLSAVDVLDRATLVGQRRVTLPFAREVLGL